VAAGVALTAGDAPAARFRTMVDNQMGGANYYAFQAWNAALMYVLTNDTTYADYAVGLVDAWVTEEEALINANMRAQVAFDSYLEVGDVIGNLALVYDWCYARLTPAQRTRWVAYANQAVWNVWNPDDARWGNTVFTWSGWSLNNPVNNYYYSFLRATLYLGLATRGDNVDADTWIDRFRTQKIGNQLVPMFASDLQGGGSREGTGYGTAMRSLFELYITWEASTGERLAELTPHARESMVYLMHATSPSVDFLSPLGDHARDSTGALFDYHRHYMEALIHLFPNDPVAPIAKRWLGLSSVPQVGQFFNFYADFLYANAGVQTAADLNGLNTGYRGVGTGHTFVRTGWDTNATWLTFVAGPYTESHAHHDQGSFTLWRNGWLAYDQNVESHSGIHQEEDVHNLVAIDVGGTRVPQRESAPPSTLLALTQQAAFAYGAADITPIYNGQAPIVAVQREWVFIKPGVLVVFDRVDTGAAANATKTWLLNVPVLPTVAGNVATVNSGGVQLAVHQVVPGIAPVVRTWTVLDADMNGGYRLDVASTAVGRSTFLNVLVLDGAATAVTANGPNGVTMALTGGGNATVTFTADAPGTQLTLTDAGGGMVHTGELPRTVETWSVLTP